MLNSQWYIPVPERKKLRLNKEEKSSVARSPGSRRWVDSLIHKLELCESSL
jgi:hypothetical protein